MNSCPECGRVSPLVTVYMVGNGSDKFIKKSIDSVFHQSYPHIELIIADGKSRTKMQEIISIEKSGKVRYVPELCGDDARFWTMCTVNLSRCWTNRTNMKLTRLK